MSTALDYIEASELPRVIACGGSTKLDRVAARSSDNDLERMEGIAAHHVAMAVLSGQISDASEYVDRKTPNGIYVTPDMADTVAAMIKPSQRYYPVPLQHGIATEVNTDWLSGRVHGRADAIAFDDAGNHLYVDDFKYGWRLSFAHMNWTLISHAIGYIEQHQITPGLIDLTISQPRPYSPLGKVRSWRLTYAELMALRDWLVAYLAAIPAALATGDHCYKCPSMSLCPAYWQAALNSIDVSFSAFNAELSNAELSLALDQIRAATDRLKQIGKAYDELAMHRITKDHATDIANYSAEPQYGHRRWNDGLTGPMIAALVGKPLAEITEPGKIKSPAQVEKITSPEVVNALSKPPFTGLRLERITATERHAKAFKTDGV